MSQPITIDQIQSLLQGITPGEWVSTDDGLFYNYNVIVTGNESDEVVAETHEENNARFIAASPAIARKCIELHQENEALRERVKELEGDELSTDVLSWLRHFTRNIKGVTPLFVETGEGTIVQPCGLSHGHGKLIINTIPKF